MNYRVLVSFAGPEIGAHAAGEIVSLGAEQAKSLIDAGFIEVVPASQVIETADLQPEAESADIKAPRKKKG